MTKTFFSSEECQAALDVALGSAEAGQRGAMASEVAAALVRDMAHDARAGDADAFEVKLGHWAIRDDEINLLDLIKDSVLAYLETKPGAVVSLAVTVARQLLALWRKGVRLTPETAQTLTELRRVRGPRELAEIAGALGWEEGKTQTALDWLSAAPARAGAVKLAEKLPDARWVSYA
ncbi:hypothetical protein AAFN86_29350 [Roseomonas sp. CAU 1739]|uniref:hypothetical protein n=1 Tax=Roseomonas sp. CAU 1739 TaxID=3140364 RepID=UPI00325AC3BE